ncbi:MAG: DNA polymerase III subunit gamma/tau [Gammaproteobacteria bacterium]|nr:DNA polymerase III subunit gamma/tau [Gammaproteobacteria bacterium]
MSYEVLARKLRPAGFDALVGQDHVVRALRHALDAGRLHHAYLFTGTRGVGKTTIARIVAKSLNCEKGVSSSPCESCSICIEVKENRFIDLIEVDAASRTGVDDTRDLLENAQYLPTRGRYKVFLIDEVHMLSTASFNALLKTLEEPPEHVKFLLATTDPKKVPVTVLSRCLQFQLKNISTSSISEYLQGILTTEGIEFETGALDVIARSASGSMRDALSLTDQAISYGQGTLKQNDVIEMLGVVGTSEVSSLIDAIANGSASTLMDVSGSLAERSADFSDVLKGLLEEFHRLAVLAAVSDQPQLFSAEELQLYYQIALVGHRDLAIAPDERSGFEMTLLRMLAFAPDAGSTVPPRAAITEASTDEVKSPEQPPAIARTPDSMQENSQVKALETGGKLADQWLAIVDQLAVGGVVKMIAENSVLISFELPNIEILLDQEHDTLLNDTQQRQLARALQESCECEVKLTLSVGVLPTESPAQRRVREALERQARAESVIQQDTVVSGLLSEFDGRIDEIRPA